MRQTLWAEIRQTSEQIMTCVRLEWILKLGMPGSQQLQPTENLIFYVAEGCAGSATACWAAP